MKKIIKLKESDLLKIVNKVMINEQEDDNNITFNYPVPSNLYVKHGGNILRSIIVKENYPGAERFKVLTKESENVILVESLETGEKSKCHFDMCWVLAKVLVN
jgi:hypothetical protein